MESFSDFLSYLGRLLLGTALPWGLGALAIAGALSLTPFGQGLIDYLRSRRRDTEALEAVLQELAELRTTLGEVVERLDATERRLLQERSQFPSLHVEQPAPASAPERVVTPH
jgi:hypothetical protein